MLFYKRVAVTRNETFSVIRQRIRIMNEAMMLTKVLFFWCSFVSDAAKVSVLLR